jgi:T-complex protein 1 subunit beta
VSTLRAAHAADPNSRMGIDITRGAAGDVSALGVFESFRVKSQMLASATEAAEMILRVDEIVKAAPRQRTG